MDTTSTRWPRAEMLTAVERSPAAVLAQDKTAWLALFSHDGVTEDPVGTSPNVKGVRPASRTGEDDLGRFYETFIAGNDIRFAVVEDFATGDEVIRDVVIHTRLSTGLAIEVPAHLIYQLVEEQGALKIRRLRAIWDLRQRSIKAIGAGLVGLYTLIVISVRMFAIQGLRGVIGYTNGLLSGIFGRGRKVVDELASAIAKNDDKTLEALFIGGGSSIEFPAGNKVSGAEFLQLTGSGAQLKVTQVTPAGWMTSFRFELSTADGVKRGLALLEFDSSTKKLRGARFFVGG